MFLAEGVSGETAGVSDGEEEEEEEKEEGLGGSPAVWPYAPAFSCLFSMADQRAHLHQLVCVCGFCSRPVYSSRQ